MSGGGITSYLSAAKMRRMISLSPGFAGDDGRAAGFGFFEGASSRMSSRNPALRAFFIRAVTTETGVGKDGPNVAVETDGLGRYRPWAGGCWLNTANPASATTRNVFKRKEVGMIVLQQRMVERLRPRGWSSACTRLTKMPSLDT
jgi:hypothetical protein